MSKIIKSLLRVPAIISSVRTLVDGGLSLGITTQELMPKDAVELFKLKGKLGFMVFKETKVLEEDVVDLPDEVKGFKGEKSPSQRLRGRMFVYYKGKHGTTKGFNTWYVDALNEIGDKYLAKMNDGQ